MTKYINTTFKIIFATIIIAFAFVWILNFILKSSYIQNAISYFINLKLKESYNIRIEFHSSSISLLPLEYSIYGVNILDISTPNKDVLLNISKIKIRVSLLSIIAGHPKLSFVEFYDLNLTDALFANILFKTKNTTNITSNSKLSNQNSINITWPIFTNNPFIEKLIFKNVNINIKVPINQLVPNNSQNFLFNIYGLNFEIFFLNKDNFKINLDMDKANVGLHNNPILTNAKIHAKTHIDSKGINLETLILKDLFHNLDVKAQGVFQTNNNHIEKITWNIQAQSTHDISFLKKFLALNGKTQGKIHLNTNINFPINLSKMVFPSFTPSIKFKLEDAYLQNFYLRDQQGIIKIYSHYLEIKDAKVIKDKTIIANYEGKVKFTSAVNLDFFAKLHNITFKELLQTFNVNLDTVNFNIDKVEELTITGSANPLKLQIKTNGLTSNLNFNFLPNKTPTFMCQSSINMNVFDDKLVFNDNSQMLCKTDHTDDVTKIKIYGKVGLYTHSGINLEFKSENFNLSLLNSYLNTNFQGTSTVITTVSGNYDNIQVINIIKSQSTIKVENISFSFINAHITINENYIRWNNVEIQQTKGGLMISPSGELRLQDLYFKTEFNIKNYKKDFLYNIFKKFLPQTIVGFDINELKASITGYLLYPLSYEGTFNIVASKIYFNDEFLADKVTANIQSNQNSISCNNARISIGSQVYTLTYEQQRTAKFNPKKTNSKNLLEQLGGSLTDTFKLQLSTFPSFSKTDYTSNSVQITQKPNLSKMPFIGQYLKAVNFEGDLGGSLTIEGTFSKVSASFDALINNIHILNSFISPIEIRGVLFDNKIDIIFNQGGNAIYGRLNVDFSSEKLPYIFYVNLFNTDLKILTDQYIANNPKNYLYINGEINLQGELTNFWNSYGYIKINDIIGSFINNTVGVEENIEVFLSKKPVTININQKNWNINKEQSIKINSKLFNFEFKTINNKLPEPVNIVLEGKSDISLLKMFIKDIDTAMGDIYIQGSINGNIFHPHIKLQFYTLSSFYSSENNVILGLPTIRPNLKNIGLNVTYENGVINIEKFQAKKGQGWLEANGFANVTNSDKSNVKIKLALHDASFITDLPFAKNLQSNISGMLYIEGEQIPLNIYGNLEIANAQSISQFDIRKELVQTIRSFMYKNVGLYTTFRNPYVNLDINIKSKNPIFVSNKNFKGNISSDLKIIGNDLNPILNGYLKIENGTFKYKRDFNIIRGLIIFDDPSSIDPRLDIVGVCEISGYQVYVTISNKASDIKIDFSIDPQVKPDGQMISRMEILQLISSGMLPKSNTENTTQNLTTQQLAQTEAFNLLISQFEDPVEKVLRISNQKVIQEIYLDAYTNPHTGSLMPRINVPLSLSEDWNMILRIDDAGWNVGVTYSINEDISINGNYDQQRELSTATGTKTISQDTGVDLKFKFSFP